MSISTTCHITISSISTTRSTALAITVSTASIRRSALATALSISATWGSTTWGTAFATTKIFHHGSHAINFFINFFI
ncbi:MAG: hypothetical protein DWI08_07510 [Planctomycetota bacterium]|nr:MAG: hypothetical protein DWI08_07510 [Planctomycetota bacterium]